MPTTPAVTREQILSFRRRVTALVDERLPSGTGSLRTAACAGLQDSMPRAALLSIHARIAGTEPTALADRSLVQVWGPRYSLYVVAADDLAVFTLGRFPDDPQGRHRATDLTSRLAALLVDGAMSYGQAGRALGVHPNALRYATTTGTIVLSWDGARQPTIRAVQPPSVDPAEARAELARRFLHVFGPSTASSFAGWAGLRPSTAGATFDHLRESLTPVTTPIGAAWILTADEGALRTPPEPTDAVRLLPSGDSYFLLQGADRELLVPHADHRSRLWTSRVWPGAVLVDGEIVGTWRRAKHVVTISAWGDITDEARDRIAAEAAALPLPDSPSPLQVDWTT